MDAKTYIYIYAKIESESKIKMSRVISMKRMQIMNVLVKLKIQQILCRNSSCETI